MRIHRIRLKNFRAFEDRVFSFGSRFNLIIGDNATGKTTLLDALSVGLGALFLDFPEPASARNITTDEVRLATYHHGDTWTVEPQYPTQVECDGELIDASGKWLRALTGKDGRTTRQDADFIRVEANLLGEAVKQGRPVNLPVVSYYGTGRLWVQLRQTRTKTKASKVDTLKPDTRFAGYRDCLNPASDVRRLLEWFKTQEITALQRKTTNLTLEAARRAILSCVPGASHVGFDVSRDQMIIRFAEKSLPFSFLSDGYRNMVAMAADIAIRCATLNPHLQGKSSEETPGVVLIDEVDLHLHPRWQRRVVDDLLRTFPRIQFFGTTHSPFIIQSLPPIEGVQLLNLDNEHAEEFANKSVEDISEEIQGIELPQRSKRFKDCLHGSIAVEHVRPKQPQPALEREWTNFLLACDNCNSIKSNTDVDLAHYFWPDRDNTARVFDYDLDQPPRISSGLDPARLPIAERTIALTGLDRVPGHPSYSDRDRRWLKRREAWGVALTAHRDLEQNDTPQMRQGILNTAVSRGFWSVWLQVFHNDEEMRSSLIKWFPGTATDCFDGNTQPIPRLGGLV